MIENLLQLASTSATNAIASAIYTRGSKNLFVDDIAAACFEASYEFHRSIRDYSQTSWDTASEQQRSDALASVTYRLTNPHITPGDNHSNWLLDRAADGWQFGHEKNVERKEHPFFVPYQELPEQKRLKNCIVLTVIDGLKDHVRKDLYMSNTDNRHVKKVPMIEQTLFRKRYRQLSPVEVQLHDEIKDAADVLHAAFLKITPSADASTERELECNTNVMLATRHLEDAVYRAVKGLTS